MENNARLGPRTSSATQSWVRREVNSRRCSARRAAAAPPDPVSPWISRLRGSPPGAAGRGGAAAELPGGVRRAGPAGPGPTARGPGLGARGCTRPPRSRVRSRFPACRRPRPASREPDEARKPRPRRHAGAQNTAAPRPRARHAPPKT